MNDCNPSDRRAVRAGTTLFGHARRGVLLAAILFAVLLPAVRAAEPTLADLRKAAKEGDVPATIALIQQLNQGGKKEQTESFTWIRKLADAGNLEAQLALALYYAKGVETIALAANPAEAEEWYFKAFKQDARAVEAIMVFYHEIDLPAPKHRDATLTRMRELAAGGDGDCQLLLGQTYKAGKLMPKDDFKAAEWFQKSAAAGNTSAKMELADALANGRGIAEDAEESTKWTISAAEDGNLDAIYAAGVAYLQGTGVKQDFAAALKYFNAGVDENDLRARYQVASMQFKGQGMTADRPTAVRKWVHLAEYSRMPEAAYSAGLAYRDGLGVEKDPKKAASLLKQAKDGDIAGAADALEKAIAAAPFEGWTSEDFELGGFLCGRNKDGCSYKIFGYAGKKDDQFEARVSGQLTSLISMTYSSVDNVRLRYRVDNGQWQSCRTLEEKVKLAKDGLVEFMVVTDKPGQTANAAIHLTVISPGKQPGTVTRYDVIENNLEPGHYYTCSVFQNGKGGAWKLHASSSSFDPKIEIGPINQDLSNFRSERSDDDSGGGTSAQLFYTPKEAGYIGIRIQNSTSANNGGQYRIIVNRPLELQARL